MSERTRHVTLSRPLAVAAALIFLAGGAGGSWLLLNHDWKLATAVPIDAPRQPSPPSAEAAPHPATVSVTIPQDVAARAGIEVAPVATTMEAARITVPAVIEPHGYKQVIVTPLAGGRISRVMVELGQLVARGQTMAEIYSPELASAQTEYLSARASLEAARLRLQRTDRLVEIGAASRQEYEEVRAEEARLATALESTRSRLVLLGMPPPRIAQLAAAAQMTSTISVPAPMAGVVTARDANVGQNVDPSMPLFTVVDLSTVWIVGDVYERDFGKVRVGTTATVTTEAFAGLALDGKVSYIDPRVDESTRTAKVRVEVVNRDRRLRLGMFVKLTLAAEAAQSVLRVPTSAVQTVGGRSVVYVIDPGQRERFIERQVSLGSRVDGHVQVLEGVAAGDVVVAKGSFFIRAERERISPAGAGAADPRRP